MRPQPSPIRFGPFRLHPTQGLSRDEREIRVTPKSLALLQALAARAGEIVTKDDLFRLVWPNTLVTEAALSSCILELRRALHDDARRPSYIETVHRRGYRLLTPCHAEAADPATWPSADWLQRAAEPLVGREAELEELSRAGARVLDGATEVVFVTGEDGIGKTALAETFLAGVAGEGTPPICAVACDEESGRGDAYRPLLDALARLCGSSGHADNEAILRRCAPTWLAELPCRGTPAEWQALRQRTSGATCRRMQRELRDALEALTDAEPLVLFIDDLQWSDAATLDWIAWFAVNPGSAAVLLVATVRQDEAGGNDPALRMIEALRASAGATVLDLGPLDPDAVSGFVRRRLPVPPEGHRGVDRLERRWYRHTEGRPFFLACLCEQVAHPQAREDRDRRMRIDGRSDRELPGTLREAVERQFARLPDLERSVLEVASLAGDRFSGAEVAAGAGLPMAEVNETLACLAQDGRFLRPGPMLVWPDGTSAPGFRFTHHLRRSAIRERLSPHRRASLHGRIGRRLEAAWGDRATEIAGLLASHFEHEADPSRAVARLHEAGALGRRRSAHAVARRHFRRALVLLRGIPDAAERDAWEALFQVALGRELIATEGLNDEVEACFARAFQLQKRLASTPRLGAVLWGLWVYHLVRGPLPTAGEIAGRLLALAQELDDPALLLEARHAQWGSALMLGEVNKVLECTRSGMALCGSRADGSLAMTQGCTLYDYHLTNHHAAICAGFFSAWADVLAGRQDAGARGLDAAVTHARDIGHPFTLALTLVFGSGVRAAMGDAGSCRRQASEGRALAEDHHFDVLRAWACIYEGWATARLGDTASGLELMNAGLAAYRHTGMSLFRPFQLALAADVLLRNQFVKEASQCVAEGLANAERVGDRLASAELYRTRAELGLATSADRESASRAEADLRRALEIARGQGASLYAARASRALERLARKTGAFRPIEVKSRVAAQGRRLPPDQPA